jgi:hypothetical protein
MFGCKDTDRWEFIREMEEKISHRSPKSDEKYYEEKDEIKEKDIVLEEDKVNLIDVKSRKNKNSKIEEVMAVQAEIEKAQVEIEKDKESFKTENNKYFSMFLKSKPKSVQFYKNQILYEVFKYIVHDKLHFDPISRYYKIFCCCCVKRAPAHLKKKKRNEKVEKESKFQEAFDLYDTSCERMKLDFELVNILKSSEDFEKFKKIYFNDQQLILFDAGIKPTINLKDNRREFLHKKLTKIWDVEDDNEDMHDAEDIKAFDKLMDDVINCEKLSQDDKKLMKIMGIDNNMINTLDTAMVNRKSLKVEKPVEIPVVAQQQNSNNEAIDDILDKFK